MSKRFIYPQEQGERKRAKLDITVSDHNFPLSQNNVGSDANRIDTWGDENDDEILLLASQACEEVYGDHNLSTLPNYSMCMQPPSTSTQIGNPIPSTSKSAFSFKKPSSSAYKLSTIVKDKFERISSPLPGLLSKVNNEDVHISDDFIFNDKICDGQDSNFIYRQLLQLQEENAKLKSENGKLSEKCVTKEGEASILRTQLKNCQTAVDNARLEKMKVQEKAQIEWSEKLATTTNQMHDLRTQLDFKNLEIISIKEKCKMLESTKVKLTQITVAGNDITSSQRHHNSVSVPYEPATKSIKLVSNAVQTQDNAHFLKLNKGHQLGYSLVNTILPLIMDPTIEQCPLLEYNEKLKREEMILNKCQIFNTIHRLPSTPHLSRTVNKKKLSLTSIYNDLTSIAAGGTQKMDNYFNILKFTKVVLSNVQSELETVLQRATTAFHKQMDQRYIDVTSHYQHMTDVDLLSGRPLYKDEQAVLGRRVTAILRHVLEDCGNPEMIRNIQENSSQCLLDDIIHIVSKICQLLADAGCGVLYSGLLLSACQLLEREEVGAVAAEEAAGEVARARGAGAAACAALGPARRAPRRCGSRPRGPLKTDYDQGVLLYRTDSCTLQVLLRQVEAALKCIQKQGLTEIAVNVTRDLILLHEEEQSSGPRCECRALLAQVTVLGLRTCAAPGGAPRALAAESAGVCRAGLRLLHPSRAPPPPPSPSPHTAGQLQLLSAHLDGNMLSEIMSTFQTSPEDAPRSYHKQAWVRSFQTFSLKD